MSARRSAALLLLAAWFALVFALSLLVPPASDRDEAPERAACALSARSANGLVLCLDRR